eukprot:2206468-Ditylum_brightwellii.AAC.1
MAILAFYIALQDKKGNYCDKLVWNEPFPIWNESGSKSTYRILRNRIQKGTLHALRVMKLVPQIDSDIPRYARTLVVQQT